MKNPNHKPFFTYLGMVCHSGLDLRSVDLDLLDLYPAVLGFNLVQLNHGNYITQTKNL